MRLFSVETRSSRKELESCLHAQRGGASSREIERLVRRIAEVVAGRSGGLRGSERDGWRGVRSGSAPPTPNHKPDPSPKWPGLVEQAAAVLGGEPGALGGGEAVRGPRREEAGKEAARIRPAAVMCVRGPGRPLRERCARLAWGGGARSREISRSGGSYVGRPRGDHAEEAVASGRNLLDPRSLPKLD